MGKVDGHFARLGRWLLAPRCLLCAEPGAEGRDLCRRCTDALPWNRSACARCGLPLSVPAAACGACLMHPPPFAATAAAFVYAFPIDRLLPRLKFHADLAAGAVLADVMTRAFDPADRPDVLVPVPLHRSRLRQRGYDQALELCRPLARSLGLPLRTDLLRRIRATDAQSELDAKHRRDNLRGAFACVTTRELPRHIALFDDVMTTGSTVQEAASALRRAGVERVDVWVLARAPRAGSHNSTTIRMTIGNGVSVLPESAGP